MNKLKKMIGAMLMGGITIAVTAVAGMTPITVFAQSKEAECTCEKLCMQDSVNEDCDVCIYVREQLRKHQRKKQRLTDL